MPRGKAKTTITNKSKRKLQTEITNNEDERNKGKNSDTTMPVKLESIEESDPSGNNHILDFNKFKFEKKPHIKIEFDKNPPLKEEVKGLWEPPHWREFLSNLRSMRSNNDAPVDSMGCHMSMDKDAPPEVIRYQSLISLMLSSQTKDEITFGAMERLKAKGLIVDNILKMSNEELGQLIYPVGFWKTKVKYIKTTTQTLKDQYNGDIPDSVEKLCKLNGVGPKMAHICMKVAWNKVTGIGVDTHVHRISNRIGWVKKPTSTPEDTRIALQSWLPFDLWSEVNHLMVGFGQTICLPINPQCTKCLNKDICPSSKGSKSPKKSPMKNKQETKEKFKVKNELESEKLPRKRKITPKKQLKVSDKNELETHPCEYDFETNKEKLVKEAKKSPKVRKATIKGIESSDIDMTKELVHKNTRNKTINLNVSESINKNITENKTNVHHENYDESKLVKRVTRATKK